MQLEELKGAFDDLQKRFGDPGLSSIYGAGCLKNPEVCFVFMNPTGKNVAADPDWQGLRAPWIGTKNVWRLFAKLGLLSKDIARKIQSLHATEWTPEFAESVYRAITDQRLYITNLAKSTQSDARPLANSIFKEYLPTFYEEIMTIAPKRIVSFGNQVSSILLAKPVKVSGARKRVFPLNLPGGSFAVYPTFYPVGQGMRNIDKAIEDIRWVMTQKAA